jgi:hypothetical protein
MTPPGAAGGAPTIRCRLRRADGPRAGRCNGETSIRPVAQTRKPAPPAVHAAVASGHPLYLDRKQAGHVVDLHQMQHIEAIGFADHHFGRRERERQIAGGR